MNLRNIVEIVVIICLLLGGGIAFLYLKQKVDDVESDLVIRKRSDIKESVEEEGSKNE